MPVIPKCTHRRTSGTDHPRRGRGNHLAYGGCVKLDAEGIDLIESSTEKCKTIAQPPVRTVHNRSTDKNNATYVNGWHQNMVCACNSTVSKTLCKQPLQGLLSHHGTSIGATPDQRKPYQSNDINPEDKNNNHDHNKNEPSWQTQIKRTTPNTSASVSAQIHMRKTMTANSSPAIWFLP